MHIIYTQQRWQVWNIMRIKTIIAIIIEKLNKDIEFPESNTYISLCINTKEEMEANKSHVDLYTYFLNGRLITLNCSTYKGSINGLICQICLWHTDEREVKESLKIFSVCIYTFIVSSLWTFLKKCKWEND